MAGIFFEWFTSGTGWAYFRARQPGLIDPVRGKIRVETFQVGHEPGFQRLPGSLEIGMILGEVIANVNDVIAAKVIRWRIVGVFHQRKKGKAGIFGDVVPVIAPSFESWCLRERSSPPRPCFSVTAAFQGRTREVRCQSRQQPR
jgi:hypothetical protein